MKKVYWAEYDLDGSFDFYITESEDVAPYPNSHLLGPFKSFGEAKRNIVFAFRDCIAQLRDGIDGAKSKKEKYI